MPHAILFVADSPDSAGFNVLSTNVDRKGVPFVSTFEGLSSGRSVVSDCSLSGKTLPIYATQWHPEKNSFEFTPKEVQIDPHLTAASMPQLTLTLAQNIPHSQNAVLVTQAMSNFFVSEARKSNHSYPLDDLTRDIVYNLSPVFTGKDGSGFEQCYELQ